MRKGTTMNDRYRNCIKALDHIRKCREKEKSKVLVPFIGYVYLPSEKLAEARVRSLLYPIKKVKHWKVKYESPFSHIESKAPLNTQPIDTSGYTIWMGDKQLN